jgi:predicted enzyme related to lactoylglutathione lyase
MKVRNPVVIHWARRMDAAVDFYSELFAAPVLSRSLTWSMLDLGDVRLALHLIDDEQPERPLPNAGLNLEVDAIDELVDHAAALGGRCVDVKGPAPAMPFRVAILEDVDGNGFELRQRA